MPTGRRPSWKRYVLRRLLKVATEVAERTDSGRLFQREGVHELKAPCASVGLDPRDGQSDSSLWSQWAWWKRNGNQGAKVNGLLVMKRLTKQILKWTLYVTDSQWKECSSETLRVNGGDFVTTRSKTVQNTLQLGQVSFRNPRQNCITVIKTARR